jgi:hypothetical protein
MLFPVMMRVAANRPRFIKHLFSAGWMSVVFLVCAWWLPTYLQAASSWDARLLVNTEPFMEISAGDGATDIEMRFASMGVLKWDQASSRFDFSAGLYVRGDLLTEGDLTINADGEAVDATIHFGSGSSAEALWYDAEDQRFAVSDDLFASGDLQTAGELLGLSLTLESGSVSLNGVEYLFPDSVPGSGYVLTTDGNGALTWQVPLAGSSEQESVLSLSPEYAGAVYFGDGTNNRGTLIADYDEVSRENYYRWETTHKKRVQDYSISVQVMVPPTFVRWADVPIEFSYRTDSGDPAKSALSFQVFDTTGATVVDLSGLSSSAWATAQPSISGTFTPGEYITMIITLYTDRKSFADAGTIHLNWVTAM